jgi:hypothetical protein
METTIRRIPLPAHAAPGQSRPVGSLPLLPFLTDFHAKVRSGRKTATARSKPYGKPGDRVQGPGVVLVLEHVVKVPLGSVANDCFWFEGLESPGEFIAIWEAIHPLKGYDPGQMVWFHRFHVEGRAPVCEAGWRLLSPEEKAAFPGWEPVMAPEVSP